MPEWLSGRASSGGYPKRGLGPLWDVLKLSDFPNGLQIEPVCILRTLLGPASVTTSLNHPDLLGWEHTRNANRPASHSVWICSIYPSGLVK